jgi:3-hydroxyisobutyrate dehydrogenase-like beta-hydroxyacid dehydrogenase
MDSLNITCIGLGNMGSPIAKNLIQAGYNVTVYNRSAEKAQPFKSLNATVAASPATAVETAAVLITMLSDDAALQSVTEEAIPAMRPGRIHLSMSTVSPAIVDRLLPLHDRHQVIYIAAPVMGRPPAAEAKMLSILTSGDKDAKQKLRPVFDAIGQRSFDFGDKPALAHVTKLALNFMIFTNIELLSEVMLFAESQGLDKGLLYETITNTSLSSPAVKLFGELMLKEQDNANGFATKLAYKDIMLAKQAAGEELKLPLADLISQHFESTMAAGNGNQDVTMLITHLRTKLMR